MTMYLKLIFRNIMRNPIRTLLAGLGTFVLVFVVTLVWSVLSFLQAATAEKSRNIKAIVTERWQIPSQMPFSYAAGLEAGAARNDDDVRIKSEDAMTWQFYGGTLDKEAISQKNILFAFAMEPSKLLTMMDELDSLPESQKAAFEGDVKKLEQTRAGILIGRQRLAAIDKRIGERIKIYSLNFRDLDLEFEIVGTFPEGRYDQSAAMNRDYLNAALDAYRDPKGQPHPMVAKSLNLVWLRVPDTETFTKLDGQIERSPFFSDPAIKCETSSSGIAVFLEAYRDILWGARWLLSPAILVTLSLVIANAISISVRERRTEIAVMKVLGFRPNQILALVLGEALLVGILFGALSSCLTYFFVNRVMGGIPFPIAFFPKFFVPTEGLYWGFAVGAITAFLGSILPAWSARTVRVAEVFAKIT